MSHPCESYTFWRTGSTDNATTASDWRSALEKLATVATIEEVVAALSHIARSGPSDPRTAPATGGRFGSTPAMFFFHDGVLPEWEDPAFVGAGAGRLTVRTPCAYAPLLLERAVLACVARAWGGDAECNAVAGVVVQTSGPSAVLRIWVRAGTQDVRQKLVEGVEKALKLENQGAVEWTPFSTR